MTSAVRPTLRSGVKTVHLTAILLVVSALLAVSQFGPKDSQEFTHSTGLAIGVLGLYWLLPGIARRITLVWPAYVVSILLFNALRGLADNTGVAVHVAYVVHLERALFGGIVPSVWLQRHLHSSDHVGAVDYFAAGVYVSYFFLPQITAIGLWIRRREFGRQLLAAIVIAAYLGVVPFFLVPTAPPWIASTTGQIPPIHRILLIVFGQDATGTFQEGYRTLATNEVASMPSLHMALTVLAAIALWRANRRIGLVGVTYAAAMAFTLVYLGEHYVVDEIAGTALAVAAWFAAGYLLARLSVRPPTALGRPAAIDLVGLADD